MTSPDLKVTGINDLQENLLIHIISFLPIKDAIATSFISKAWRNLWTHSPSLDFCSQEQMFAPFVDHALQLHHHANLRSLSIDCEYHDDDAHLVDNWVGIAAQNSVQKLKIDFSEFGWNCDFGFGDNIYNLSLTLLSSASLTTFILHRCRLVSSADAVFLSLRTLYLCTVDMTDKTILHLIAGCPQLENLKMENCRGIRHLNISSTRLKNLALSRYYYKDSSVEIDAPNLRFLDCSHYVADDYSFKDMSSLVRASVDFSHYDRRLEDILTFDPWCKIVESLTTARRLEIGSWWGEYLLWKMQHHHKILPHHVEYLELTMSFSKVKILGLAAILNHSPNLGTVVIHPEYDKDDIWYDVEVSESYYLGSLPQLKILKIYACGANDEETEMEMELVKRLLMRATSLKEMILAYGKRSKILKEHSEGLQNFPRSSKDANISIVDEWPSFSRFLHP